MGDRAAPHCVAPMGDGVAPHHAEPAPLCGSCPRSPSCRQFCKEFYSNSAVSTHSSITLVRKHAHSWGWGGSPLKDSKGKIMEQVFSPPQNCMFLLLWPPSSFHLNWTKVFVFLPWLKEGNYGSHNIIRNLSSQKKEQTSSLQQGQNTIMTAF